MPKFSGINRAYKTGEIEKTHKKDSGKNLIKFTHQFIKKVPITLITLVTML